MAADGTATGTARTETRAPPRRIEWRRGFSALRALIRDPEQTDQVFALLQALAGDSGARLYEQICTFSEGRALLAEQPRLMDVLSDREGLASLPSGSFGRAYAAFMGAENLSAKGLADAQDAGRRDDPNQSPEHRWFFDRLRDMHDLWHVLTGYGRDLPGEAALLAFSYAQTKNRAIGLIVLTAAVRGPKTLDCHWQRTLFRAWRRGRRAALLPMARFEELLPRPLEEARRALHIDPIERAHPGGFPGSEASAAAA